MKVDDLAVLWGKSQRDSLGGDGEHPLLFHSVDVGNVAAVMWEDVVAPSIRSGLAHALGLEEDGAGPWVAFVIACHDLGKAGPLFQAKVEPAMCRAKRAGFDFPRLMKPQDTCFHGDVTAADLGPHLARHGCNGHLAEMLAVVVGGHHGRFPANAKVAVRHHVAWASGRGGRWAEARCLLVDTLADVFGIADHAPPRSEELDHPTAMLLGGLASVADWLGSKAESFPFSSDSRLADYVPVSRERARATVEDLHWQPWAPMAGRQFQDVFGFPPRPLQREASDVAESIGSPCAVVIEAPTGEGKTEAALHLARTISATCGHGGVYFALPTQATSNQMFGRVRGYLTRDANAQVVNLQLLHGHASLVTEFRELIERDALAIGPVYDDAVAPGEARVAAQEWFTNRKRGLLSPFGVGTVDQVLMAVLQTRHVFVRLYGLAQKVVIVDEVHAYDTYMSSLLERAIEWLGAMGASVVLLSATLPERRREGLLQAYARGTSGAEVRIPRGQYPGVTWVTADGAAGARGIETAEHNRRHVALDRIEDLTRGLAARLKEALGAGGVAGVVCNTVTRAQEVYRVLAEEFDSEDPEVLLFHARYPYHRRRDREEKVLEWCDARSSEGRTGPRPARVVVATQVIEQSLDIDFDLLVTDFAPIDLILQRVGRLHRHEAHVRPPALAQPAVWLVDPPLIHGVPRFRRGDTAVYHEHVLLRTWMALRGLHQFAVPDEVSDLVEAAYGDSPLGATVSPLAARLACTAADLAELQGKYRSEAALRDLPEPGTDCRLTGLCPDPREEDAPELHPAFQALTRLTELGLSAVCLLLSDDGTLRLEASDSTIDLGGAPNDLVRELLEHSVALTHRRVVGPLLGEPVPAGWRRSPLLRHHRPLVFGMDRTCRIGSALVRDDPELGIVVERIQG